MGECVCSYRQKYLKEVKLSKYKTSCQKDLTQKLDIVCHLNRGYLNHVLKQFQPIMLSNALTWFKHILLTPKQVKNLYKWMH